MRIARNIALLAASAILVCGRLASGEFRTITVTVRAYCPCRRCTDGDMLDATNRRIKPQDYTVAVSPDLERYFPVSRNTKIFVEGYNRPGTLSTCSDRTKYNRRNQIEVLMTLPKNGRSPHERAWKWGHKEMTFVVEER